MWNSWKLGLVVVGAVIALAVAGCSGSKNKSSNSGSSGGQNGGVTVTTAAATSGGPATVNVVGGERANGSYYLTATPPSVKSGPTVIAFKNVGTRVHEVVVLKTGTPANQLKVGADNTVSEAASVGEDSETNAGKSKTTTITLAPGKYVLVCNIAGHYKKGMYFAFTVTGS
jgi:uncharacterized cupredoxin-like copper-binding protein